MIHPNLTGRRRARAINHAHGPPTVTLEAAEPKAEIGILVTVKFWQEKFRVCHGSRECEELW
jgi:hypothetical protein